MPPLLHSTSALSGRCRVKHMNGFSKNGCANKFCLIMGRWTRAEMQKERMKERF